MVLGLVAARASTGIAFAQDDALQATVELLRDPDYLPDMQSLRATIAAYGSVAGEEPLASEAIFLTGLSLHAGLDADIQALYADEHLDLLVLMAKSAIGMGQGAQALQPAYKAVPLLVSTGRTESAIQMLLDLRERMLLRLPRDQHLWAYYLDEKLIQLHESRGDWDSVFRQIKRTESLVEGLPYESLEAYDRTLLADELRVLLAITWVKLGLPDRAVPLLRRATPALKAAADKGHPVVGGLLGAYRMQATILLATGRLERAIEEVVRLFAENEDHYAKRPEAAGLLTIVAAQASELLATEDAEWRAESIKWYARALASEALEPSDVIECGARMALLETDRGAYALAATLLENAQEALDAQPESALRYQAFLDSVAARWSTAGGESPEAWPGRRLALDRSVDRMVEQLASQPLRSGGYGFQRYRMYRSILMTQANLALRFDGEAGPRHAFEAIFGFQGLHTLVRTFDAPKATIRNLRKEVLDPGVGLLVVFPDDGGSHVFALDDAGLVHERTESMQALRERVEAFSRDLATAKSLPDGASSSPAAELSNVILPPRIAERVANWHTLLVVRNEDLFGLRLEALPNGSGGHFGLSHALGYVPSLAWALHAAREREARTHADFSSDLLWIAHPEPSLDWPRHPPLQVSKEEARSLTSPFQRVVRCEGPLAQAVRLRDAGSSRALHVVLHGLQDPKREAPAGLLFGPTDNAQVGDGNGAVFSEDVTGAGTTAPLVILSSCSIGSGPLRVGDGETSTMTGAFLRAGALGVIATSADVHQRPTLALMADAMGPITEGVAPAEALRRARVARVDAGDLDVRTLTSIHATGLVHRQLFDPAGRGTSTGTPRSWWIAGCALGGLALAILLRSRLSAPSS